MKWNSVTKPFKKLLVSHGGSTAGHNSAGRITIYHRGGGAKRLQRKIDLKRSTSSMGVVERIEYDPNRSSRLALVRWIEGVHPSNQRDCDKDFSPPQKVVEPITTEVAGKFPLACLAPGLMGSTVGNKDGKISSVKDVFVSAFGSKRAKGETLINIPRAAVAGAKPSVFAPKIREQVSEGKEEYSLTDVQRWRKDSCVWDHKLKRKAAVPWLSFVHEEPVGLAKVAQNDKSVGKSSKNRHMVDRVPLTYILASDKLEEGKMVMNYDWSKHPNRS
ncbi:60S ribosomal protein L2, mitochondrial-like [Amaranthus tricolor]|uniref:60S ribosomal protein L2, mitochondrial-like n=1 Tax=Amaranthus tricolor TaxID=29722 RepID=UPI0025858AA0|nr:60S ribosomal protein L2, mitochondrial-like [Amaranthus tricolor]XP_057547511.1 60S ribosomal protein L2, mitochondrial-like [Amaranthus tricolor]XP_057547512.1 60S ribosomal protein L2, mitochondrial-like [Amaranthus tricolor]XP_057547513.1 60S ribosomal protein L2, mitochondrial-like [Amaranthus tricolor]XP_057547515.1 60S ribosomal protein L2, mitochondrial-like [Amaranthus tricolor]